MTVNIETYMKMSCKYEKFVSHDDAGNPTYAEPVTVKCRFSIKPKRVLGRNGETISAIGNIHVQFPVDYNDRFSVDDLGNGILERTPLEIHNNYNKNGTFAYAKVII